MQDTLQRIEKKIDAMQGELTAVKGGLAAVQSEVTGVKGEVTGLKGEVTGLKGEVTGLKGEVTEVKRGLAAVETRLGTVEGGLSGLKETVHHQGLRQEYLIDKVTITMEGVDGVRKVLDDRFAEVLKQLDQRVQPVELATRYLATKKTKPR